MLLDEPALTLSPAPSPESSAAGDATADGKYCCYMLRSADDRRTYVGITNDLSRRLRRHNGEVKGGARATRSGRPWRVLAVVRGFPSKVDAERFEWRAKRQRATKNQKLITMKGALPRRCANLCEVLNLKQWTKSSRPSQEMPLSVTWYGSAPFGLRGRYLPEYIREERCLNEFVPERPVPKQVTGKRRKQGSSTKKAGLQGAGNEAVVHRDAVSPPPSAPSTSSSSSSSDSSSRGPSPAESSSASSSSSGSLCLVASFGQPLSAGGVWSKCHDDVDVSARGPPAPAPPTALLGGNWDIELHPARARAL